jgi:fatty-acyl-CoA synthase
MLGEMFDIRPSDVIVCGLPLFHVNGVVVTGLAPFMHGARVLLAGREGFRNPKLVAGYWQLVERYRVTTFSGVPTVYAALLNVPIGGADLSSLRFGICGAAPMPVELFKRFEQATGIRLLEGFGMTETTAAGSIRATSAGAMPTAISGWWAGPRT